MSGFHPTQLRLVGDTLTFRGTVIAKLVPDLPASLLYDLEEKFGRKDRKGNARASLKGYQIFSGCWTNA